jgi:hypothetical protein
VPGEVETVPPSFDWCGFPLEIDDTGYAKEEKTYRPESNLIAAKTRDEEDEDNG